MTAGALGISNLFHYRERVSIMRVAEVSEEILSASHLRCLIDLVERALVMADDGVDVVDGGETRLPYPDGTLLSYTGYVGFMQAMGGKILNACETNPGRGLPYVQATTVICRVPDASLLAVMDGGFLTAVRTACASAVGTRWCANPAPEIVGVIGYGLQARTHVLALMQVGCRRALVTGRSVDRARAFAAHMRQTHGLPVEAVDGTALLCREADVIVTATRSSLPVLAAGDLRPGHHVNVVGRFEPGWREVHEDVFRHAHVVVDSRPKFLHAWASFFGDEGAVHELGAVIKRGGIRQSSVDVTVFKPVGMGIFDVVAGKYAYDHDLLR